MKRRNTGLPPEFPRRSYRIFSQHLHEPFTGHTLSHITYDLHKSASWSYPTCTYEKFINWSGDISLSYESYDIDIHNNSNDIYHYICSSSICLHYIERTSLLSCIACMIQMICDQHQHILQHWMITQNIQTVPQQYITLYHGIRIPDISIYDYLLRISTSLPISSTTFLLAYIYLQRYHEILCMTHTSCEFPWNVNTMNHLTIHRLLITSIMIASKYHDDTTFSNKEYAQIGGLSLTELNKLELHFLHTLDYKLYVTHDLFHTYYQDISHHSHHIENIWGGPTHYITSSSHRGCTWKIHVPR